RVRDEYNIPERYMLNVGTIEDRKNHSTIVKALARLNDPEIPLVIVSKHTSLQEKLEYEIQSLGITDRVRIINNVTFDRLPALYQGSQAAIYFSYFEGFGIPVLEGLASGVPVIAATGSCLEEAGGAGAIYCNPFAPDELADAMRQVLSDRNLRQQLSDGGKEHLKNFSTETLRDNLRKFYNRLI
ncbi:glycosyltransferase family 1 protein, partial [uncultured Duncaniella sp.]